MNEKISSRQAILLITICRIVTILTIMPIIYIEPANQDTWIVILVSCFYTILTAIPLLFLSRKFNNLNFIGYIKMIFGKIVGKIIGFVYIIFYTRTAILFSYISIQMIRSTFLPDTKPMIVIIFLIISCVYIASKGSIAIGRYAELFVPIILFFIGIFIILGYKNVELSVLLPIYRDSTFWSINFGAIKLTYLFVDVSILIMIGNKLENTDEIGKIFIKSVIYSLLFILVTVVVTQGALGVQQSKHSNFPFLAYIRLINSYSIFERVESIYILLWIFAMIIKITTYIHIINEGLKEVFKYKSENIFLYLIGFVGIVSTSYFADVNPKFADIVKTTNGEYLYYFIHKTIIPLIALLVYFIRRKNLGSSEKFKI